MKWKVRIVIPIAVTFILIVSFKILEPEIHGLNTKDENDLEEHPPGHIKNGGNLENRRGDVVMSNNRKETAEAITQWFLDRYQIVWNYNLPESPWETAARWVSSREIHPDHAPEIGAILKRLHEAPIIHADVGYRGTQLKLGVTLEGGQRAVFKPSWYARGEVVTGSPYAGHDRHNGEIAAFNLNRLLGFRRTPLVVGRVIDLEKEIRPVASAYLLKTFFQKDGNTCFYGKCHYCLGPQNGVCAEGTRLEGVLVLWLPPKWTFKMYKHPWSRTYVENRKAAWETFDEYCTAVKTMPMYSTGPRLLDILDASVFDYIIGNADRHHYETFKNRTDSMLVMMDSGKSFGNPYWDEKSILAPIYQCCNLRRLTWERLQLLRDGVLGQVMRKILSYDPISPVLTKDHLVAMDRRLEFAVDILEDCIQKHGVENVLISAS